jgi:hypothetical protein
MHHDLKAHNAGKHATLAPRSQAADWQQGYPVPLRTGRASRRCFPADALVAAGPQNGFQVASLVNFR